MVSSIEILITYTIRTTDSLQSTSGKYFAIISSANIPCSVSISTSQMKIHYIFYLSIRGLPQQL